ncbi:MAG TPA: hypothetical protein VE526_03955 [Solirubrobacteraceae bacterium]|jgi:hypothetical protein|nr:hypothetical protein [Solirubrobacteraceae bacterium]
MRFVDFLKATVLLCAGAATLLAALTIVGGSRTGEQGTTLIAVCWWALAALIGARIGRHHAASPPIARLLADAKMQTSLPEPRPAITLVNRLWPLLVVTIVAAALSFFLPQVAGVAAGFAIIWALAWRRQDAAVTAIEERDGFRFYVDRTGIFAPIRLIRTRGLAAG